MREHGLKPNEINRNAGTCAFEKGVKCEPALDLLQEMKELTLKPKVIRRSGWRR